MKTQKNVDFKNLEGKIIKEIIKSDDNERLTFICNTGICYETYHNQDCCEYVSIDDISGNLNDLLNQEILSAEESTNNEDDSRGAESFTWTFYTIRTLKDTIQIKWFGSSNGYYSESVSFYEVVDDYLIRDTKIDIIIN